MGRSADAVTIRKGNKQPKVLGNYTALESWRGEEAQETKYNGGLTRPFHRDIIKAHYPSDLQRAHEVVRGSPGKSKRTRKDA